MQLRTYQSDPSDRTDRSHKDVALCAKRFLGGTAERVTPVPIPNTEVKPLWADGTAWVAMWESRSPPGIFIMKKPCQVISGGAFSSF